MSIINIIPKTQIIVIPRPNPFTRARITIWIFLMDLFCGIETNS